MGINKLKVSAPGRISLFGEHLDYLNLPVITAAINLRIEIEGIKRNDKKFVFNLPDLNETDSFFCEGQVKYIKERDYLRSAFNVLERQNVQIPAGYDCTILSKIPINSGTSSSSAMIVAWVKFLLTIAEDKRADNPLEIAKLAHQAEVLEFNEPGGMMDHYTTSLGGVLFIEFNDQVKVEKLKADIGIFVLGDSLEPKDTKEILGRVKGGMFEILKILKNKGLEIDLEKIQYTEIKDHIGNLSSQQIDLIGGMLDNRDITLEAYKVLNQEKIDKKRFGLLLSECQTILREKIKISIPKLDRLISDAVAVGATGGKLNGSGGGGCMFVCAPVYPEKAVRAIENAGGKAYVIKVDEGVRVDNCEYD